MYTDVTLAPTTTTTIRTPTAAGAITTKPKSTLTTATRTQTIAKPTTPLETTSTTATTKSTSTVTMAPLLTTPTVIPTASTTTTSTGKGRILSKLYITKFFNFAPRTLLKLFKFFGAYIFSY